MSGRLAVTLIGTCRNWPALAVGLLVVCMVVAIRTAPVSAQPPTLPPGTDIPDDRPPLPASEPARVLLGAKYRIPNQDRAIFVGRQDRSGGKTGGIRDDEPLASEKQNPDEYNAWTEVVSHVTQFQAAELEQHATTDLTPDDLIYPSRKYLRLDLIRFDGKLTKARRVRSTKALAEVGVAEIFEGWLVPTGESPANPVCIVFTTWPANLTPLPDRVVGEDAGPMIVVDRWVSFAGFSFKCMAYPGPEADAVNPTERKWSKAPLLVGRSVTPLASPPPELTQLEIRKDLRVFKLIHDEAQIARNVDNWEEVAAWNRVVLHAHRFTTEELEAGARKDVTFADLMLERRGDYKLQLIAIEGRLIRLKRGESNKRMLDAGIPVWYEGWVVPKGEPRGLPVCVILTELPPGLEPKPLMNRWVSFAGYSFKLMIYESGEHQKYDPAKNVWKKAPLLIGRSVVLRDDEKPAEPSIWTNDFTHAVLLGIGGVVGTALALAWWFRRGDQKARAEINAMREKNNPFGDGLA